LASLWNLNSMSAVVDVESATRLTGNWLSNQKFDKFWLDADGRLIVIWKIWIKVETSADEFLNSTPAFNSLKKNFCQA
jgi:hypothetical protein